MDLSLVAQVFSLLHCRRSVCVRSVLFLDPYTWTHVFSPPSRRVVKTPHAIPHTSETRVFACWLKRSLSAVSSCYSALAHHFSAPTSWANHLLPRKTQ